MADDISPAAIGDTNQEATAETGNRLQRSALTDEPEPLPVHSFAALEHEAEAECGADDAVRGADGHLEPAGGDQPHGRASQRADLAEEHARVRAE